MDWDDSSHAFRWADAGSSHHDARGYGHGGCTPPQEPAEDPGETDGGETGGGTDGGEAAAGWTGDRVNVIWLSPNEQEVQDLGTFTVGPDLDKIDTPVSDFFLYLGTQGITFVYTGDAAIGWEPGLEFVGFKFTDLTNRPIESVEVDDRSTVELLPQGLSSGNNYVQVNLLDAAIPPIGLLNLEVFFG